MRLSPAQVFEEIPRHEHCGIMNALAGLASRWLAVTMGQLGQGGGHHIANRHKCAPSRQTPLMHVLIDPRTVPVYGIRWSVRPQRRDRLNDHIRDLPLKEILIYCVSFD